MSEKERLFVSGHNFFPRHPVQLKLSGFIVLLNAYRNDTKHAKKFFLGYKVQDSTNHGQAGRVQPPFLGLDGRRD